MSLSRHFSGGYLGWIIRALWAIAALAGSTAFAQVSFDDDLFGVRIDARQRTTLWGYTQIRNQAATAADPATWFFSGLFRSTDNGATWTSLRVPWQRARMRQVELDPLASGVAYVLVWAGRQYLWRTQDGGANWTALTTGLPENGAPLASLYVHGNPAAVYLQLGNMLYKSADGGQSFGPLGTNGCASRVEHNRTDPRRLYCGSVNGDILSSTDEGLTWTTGGRVPTGRPGVLISNDGIQVLSDPARPGLLLISVWGVTNSGTGDSQFDAVYRSPDGGRTFAGLNPMPSLHTLQASPDRRLLFVTGSGVNVIRSRNFGDSWEQMSYPVGQLGDLGFDPLDANILWSHGRRRSTDSGTTFTNVTREFFPRLLSPPALRQTLETGTGFLPYPRIADGDGNEFRLDALRFRGNVPWLGEDVFGSPQISAVGLTPGVYRGSWTVGWTENAVDLEVELTVVDRSSPGLRFNATVQAGNGRSDESAAGARPAPGDNGPVRQATLRCCSQLAYDRGGRLYIIDEYRVRRIDAQGNISTYAGTGASGNTGDGNAATAATFNFLVSGTIAPDGALYLVDGGNGRVRVVTAGGNAGTFFTRPSGWPSFFSTVIAADQTGAVYLANTQGLYRLQGNPATTQLLTAGTALGGTREPTAMAVDGQGNVYIAYASFIVRRSAQGAVTLAAGSREQAGFAGDNSSGADSLLLDVRALAVDSRDNLYFSDAERVRVLTRAGRLETVAGNGLRVPPIAAGASAESGAIGTVYGLAVNARNEVSVASSSSFIYQLTPQAAGSAPVLPANGVVSLAAGAPVVAPGAIFSLYGTQLSRNTSQAAGAPLPVSLGGVQVELNSRNVPLFFVSPGQINAQMPFDTAEGVVRVRVIRDGVPSGEATVRVARGAPDILVYDGTQAVAVDESNKLIGAANPVVAGRVMVVYLTGIGPVSPALAAGVAAPGDALRRASLPFSATLSGQPAEVAFLGLTPGFVGLAQANITVPPETPAGPQPLVLTVGGAESNRVTVQVVQP